MSVKNELVFELEPSGNLKMSLKASESSKSDAVSHIEATARPSTESGHLVRKKAIRKSVIPILGHAFSRYKSSFIVKCAICRDFIWSKCHACVDCSLRCHKNCIKDVYFKCPQPHKSILTDRTEPQISMEQRSTHDSQSSHDRAHDDSPGISPDRTSTPAQLNGNDSKGSARTGIHFNLPHQFKKIDSIKPSFCSYCGLIGSVYACRACNQVTAHEHCKALLPNHCGIQKQMIELLKISLQDEGLLQKNRPASVEESRHTKTKIMSYISTLPPLTIGSSGKKVDAKSKHDLTSLYSLKDFDLVAVIGKGNFGKVFLVQRKSDGHMFAMKVLKKNFILENDDIDSLFTELQVYVIGNDCPFLIRLQLAFQDQSSVYFLMEYASGGDLMFRIQKQGTFSFETAVFYGAQVVLALEYFHQRGVVYRDLKLDNILIGDDGYLKLADYGLCKGGMKNEESFFTRTFCGTPEFMAPEILYNEPYGFSVDFWAFGILLYELILGKAPFYGKDENQIFNHILSDEPSFHGNIPLEAIVLIKSLLAKDPSKRLSSWARVKKSRLFSSIDFEKLSKKQYPPPFLPAVSKDPRKPLNFDSEFINETPTIVADDAVVPDSDQKLFKDFIYHHPS